ncbi:MAG: hypothetical protein KatS3mg054_0148 [Chloroflexus sp.]|nr:MAG: hypothetical protein KatS3mg054_0148 [Chloroflexus sp.]
MRGWTVIPGRKPRIVFRPGAKERMVEDEVKAHLALLAAVRELMAMNNLRSSYSPDSGKFRLSPHSLWTSWAYWPGISIADMANALKNSIEFMRDNGCRRFILVSIDRRDAFNSISYGVLQRHLKVFVPSIGTALPYGSLSSILAKLANDSYADNVKFIYDLVRKATICGPGNRLLERIDPVLAKRIIDLKIMVPQRRIRYLAQGLPWSPFGANIAMGLDCTRILDSTGAKLDGLALIPYNGHVCAHVARYSDNYTFLLGLSGEFKGRQDKYNEIQSVIIDSMFSAIEPFFLYPHVHKANAMSWDVDENAVFKICGMSFNVSRDRVIVRASRKVRRRLRALKHIYEKYGLDCERYSVMRSIDAWNSVKSCEPRTTWLSTLLGQELGIKWPPKEAKGG